MSAAVELARAEEREAFRRHREAEAFRRRMERAQADKLAREARERRRVARQALDELRPRLTAARRAYFAALSDACRDRARDTDGSVAARFDAADRSMNTLMALCARRRQLEREARS